MSARQSLAVLLAVVAALAAVGGAAAWIVRSAVVEQEGFADRAVSALEREAVRDAVAAEITAQVLDRVPGGLVSEARVRRLVDRSMDTAAFRRAFRAGAVSVNRTLFAGGDDTATLGISVNAVLAAANPQLAALLPQGSDAELLTVRTGDLPIETRRGGRLVDTLAIVLPALACFALAAALLAATDRRWVLRWAALATIVAGALLLGGTLAGRALVIDAARAGGGVTAAQARAAAGDLWDVYAGGLRTAAFVAIGAGLLLAAGTAIGSRRRV